jgi:hypothetical protein
LPGGKKEIKSVVKEKKHNLSAFFKTAYFL